jgi:flagellar motor switch protein FliM
MELNGSTPRASEFLQMRNEHQPSRTVLRKPQLPLEVLLAGPRQFLRDLVNLEKGDVLSF